MTMPNASSQRLAMLMAETSVETPLTRVNGLERAVLLSGKGDRDVIEMVVLLRGGGAKHIALDEGRTELSPDPTWMAFYFKKIADAKVPTTIHVVLANG